ncbi:MAG TPA: DUF6263 family protein [Polyangiaceae bacterium]|nr:DUF6263 family protein [Polyangiaceae bacterium]
MRPFAYALLAVVLAACSKDEAKPQQSPAPSAEPIPSDLVYNSVFDDKGNAPPQVVVAATDAGTDGGTRVVSGSTAKLLDPGQDPKAPLVYSYVDKPRTVTATVKMSAAGQEQPPFRFTFTARPRPKLGLASDAHVEVRVTKMEMDLGPNPPPQLAAQKGALEKGFVGVGASFDATSHGDIDNLDFESDKATQGVGELVVVFQPALELLVIPLPDEAVGIGAKWVKTNNKRTEDGQGASTTTMTLLARDAQTATIKVEAQSSVQQNINDPRAPKGASISRSTKGSYTVVVRFDGVAQKVTGSSDNALTQKAPGQPDQSQTAKISQDLESK